MNLEELVAAAQAAKPAPVEVPLPELGEGASVWVRPLSAGDLLDMVGQTRAVTGEDGPAARRRTAIVLSTFLCDKDGAAIAPSPESAYRLLQTFSMTLIERITSAGNQLNGFDKKALEKN